MYTKKKCSRLADTFQTCRFENIKFVITTWDNLVGIEKALVNETRKEVDVHRFKHGGLSALIYSENPNVRNVVDVVVVKICAIYN